MSKELVISANRHETRVAMIEDDQVVEIFHQRENASRPMGNLRVIRLVADLPPALIETPLVNNAPFMTDKTECGAQDSEPVFNTPLEVD